MLAHDRVARAAIGDGQRSGFVERVESDTNRDGRIDKWESYEASTRPGASFLRSVSMDPDSSGRPTRRLFYRPDGSFDRSETINK